MPDVGVTQTEGQSPTALRPVTTAKRLLPIVPTPKPTALTEEKGTSLKPSVQTPAKAQSAVLHSLVGGEPTKVPPLTPLNRHLPKVASPLSHLPQPAPAAPSPLKPATALTTKPITGLKPTAATNPPLRRSPVAAFGPSVGGTSNRPLPIAAEEPVRRRAIEDSKVKKRGFLTISEL